MALKGTWSIMMLVTVIVAVSSCLGNGTEEDSWDETINAIGNGINWVAETVSKAKKMDMVEIIKEGKRMLLAEEPMVRFLDEEEASEAEGRLFFGTGANATSVTLNLQALQSALGAAIVIGLAVIIILIIISLVTGRDIYSLSKGFTNRFTYPYEESWYAPNHNYYRDESSYTAYRALEEADKKYGEDQQPEK